MFGFQGNVTYDVVGEFTATIFFRYDAANRSVIVKKLLLEDQFMNTNYKVTFVMRERCGGAQTFEQNTFV